MLTIHAYGTFNGIKVLLTAEELNADYQYVHVDLAKGQNRKPEYLAKNPTGKIPTLEHNGETIGESNTICRYLARIHDNRLYSDDPMKAAKIDQVMDFMAQHAGRWLGMYFWQEVVRPHYMKLETDQAVLEEAAGFLEQQLPIIDNLLADHPYLAGDELTIADTVSHAQFQTHEITSVDLTPYQNIQRWYDEFNQRPSVSRVKDLVASH